MHNNYTISVRFYGPFYKIALEPRFLYFMDHWITEILDWGQWL